jgi:N-acetylglutamate synthase-like GNAT family acetyltransferase
MIKKEWINDSFLFSTEKELLNVEYVHSFLSEKSYWAKGVPKEVVEQSIRNSLAIGIYDTANDTVQVGFARVISDFATFAYLADVFVDEKYRGRALSKKLMEFIFSLNELKGLRRFILATADAHSLYARYGFKPLKAPDRFMEVHDPDVYRTVR